MKIDENILKDCLWEQRKNFSGFDADFFDRIWHTPLNEYTSRLKAIQFTNHKHVLDAGCGFGQWSLCLAELNQKVFAIDTDEKKIAGLAYLCNRLSVQNIFPTTESIEQTSFDNQFFDAIFCFSVLYLTDYKKTIQEFARILKTGGKLYICSNGLGWYLYNIIENNNTSFPEPHTMAINAIAHTFTYLSENKYDNNTRQLIVSGKQLISELKRNGFTRTIINRKGIINSSENKTPASFFKPEYYGIEGVFEIIAEK